MANLQAATVAYWRFEAGPANTDVIHTGNAGVFDGAIPDASGNGNNLSSWSQGGGSGFSYRTDVPDGQIAAVRMTNRFSVKNTGAYPAMFTSGPSGVPTGPDLRMITPAQWTVEVSYKAEANAGYRTVISRDARSVVNANGDLAAFYLQVRPDDSVGVSFADVTGVMHSAFSPPGWVYGFNFGSNPEGVGVGWYNLAAVSDGVTLKMYVNNVLVASTDMTLSGSTNRSLARGNVSGTDWTAGGWAVGRGLYAGGHTDRAYGFVDEVRISNSALGPGEFLFASRPRISGFSGKGGAVSFSVAGGQSGATAYVLRTAVASQAQSYWTPIAIKTFDATGGFAYAAPLDSGVGAQFFSVRTTSGTPVAGPLSYELAGGSPGWSADIRSRIVYAMDGAVALYNRHGTFRKHVYANYNPSVPTAQANFDGWMDFGGQIGYRTALHELSHTMGIGTASNYRNFIQNGTWTGANALQQLRQFDGSGAILYTDGTHFWPYGLNYESEGGTESNRRHVLMVSAFRRDMGLQ